MLSDDHPDRIQIAFDDHRLVANPGDKMMTLVASALAGGDCMTTPTCCALAVRPAPSAAWSGRHPPGGPSCFGPEQRALRSVFRLG